MKKFLLKVLLFFALVVVMDFAWDGVFSWLRSHAKGGSTENCEYIANRCESEPLFGLIDVNDHMRSQEMRQIVIDSLKLSYVERLIVEAKINAIPIVCTISPEFGTESDMSDYYPEIDLCLKHNIPCVNSINYEFIAGNPDLFQDLSHLNNKGAEAYTRYIVSLLKNDENIHLNNR